MPDETVNASRQIIADLQREVAQLRAERDEALDQQTATAEVLEVINSSPGNLGPVFDAMLEKAMRLCTAAFGYLLKYDGERFQTVAHHGLPPRFAEYLPRMDQPGPIGAYARILGGAPLVHVTDLTDGDAYRTSSLRQALVDLGGARTGLIVALRKEDRLLGIFTIYRQEVRLFSDKQIALLQNFAAQAVIAMENARLIAETREALEQQTATAEVLQVISNSLTDTQPVFEAIVQSGLKLFPDAAISVALSVEDQVHAVAVAETDAARAEAWRRRFPFPLTREYMHSAAILDKQVIDIPDVRDAPIEFAAGSRNFLASGYRGITIVPMRRGEAAIGALSVVRRAPGPLSAEQLAILQTFANQAVIAIENARLITETREALEQQTATAEVLQVINSSPGDLAPVFDAILEKSLQLCDAVNGHFYAYDGELLRPLAAQGEPRFVEWMRHRRPFRPAAVSPLGGLFGGEPIVHFADALTDGAFKAPELRELVDIGKIRTTLIVGLRKDDILLGSITVFRQEVRPFTGKQIALLQNFAAQAVIAMENARLLGELRARTEEVAGLNRDLEARVASQLAELERTGKLRRFLAPQLADLIVAQGDESILESHRREIVVVFCDLRGFTAFAERAEPEEVMALLRDYHAALGPIVASFEGTLDHYAGDGIMVFFNDPLPTPEPAKRAIAMAVAMREEAQQVLKSWRRHGHDIGFGCGISQGYATLGQIGFAERMDYTAIGTVTNLAARLCGEAKDGQILVSRRVALAVEDSASLEEIGDLSLKGLSQAVAVYNVVQ
jgi:class 3 adenylate cyclase